MASPSLVAEATRLGILPKEPKALWSAEVGQENCIVRVHPERSLPPIKSAFQWFLHAFGVIGFFASVFALCFVYGW